jgi:methylenetetrahydrofolate dehydrogenase (NADP+)/methenyltetrahydrofolate cyclohydrolase
MLKARGLDIEVLTSNSEYKEEKIKDADVIISGIGEGKYLTGDMLKENVVLIDAGTSESNGSIVGDVDIESVKDVASFVSSVPGGVGPVTIAMLFKNLLIVAKNKNNDK